MNHPTQTIRMIRSAFGGTAVRTVDADKRSSVVRPARWPASRSAWRTHRRSVSVVQPALGATRVSLP
jgi:hypothetical protein